MRALRPRFLGAQLLILWLLRAKLHLADPSEASRSHLHPEPRTSANLALHEDSCMPSKAILRLNEGNLGKV